MVSQLSWTHSSGWGVAEAVDADISLVANSADAVANAIPLIGTAKGAIEDVAKVGIKNISKIFVKDAAEELFKAESKQIEEQIAKDVKSLTQEGASFGRSTSTDYRSTFFEANPELEGDVVVHHAVEQQTLTRYPGVVTEEEIHSLENLRGIPKEVNSDLHLSQIRKEWNSFYREFEATGTTPTKGQLLEKATQIDAKFGSQFNPPVKR